VVRRFCSWFYVLVFVGSADEIVVGQFIGMMTIYPHVYYFPSLMVNALSGGALVGMATISLEPSF
jgi:hypothetical protein